MEPELQELVNQQRAFLAEFARAMKSISGGAQALAGPPGMAVSLKALDRQRGTERPVEFDPQLRGLALTFEQKERTFVSSGTMAASDGELYAGDRNWRDCLLKVSLADTSQRTFQVNYVTGSAGAAADSNLLFSIGTILYVGHPGYSLTGFGLKKGDSLRGLCSSANKVSWMLFAIEEP